MKKLATFVAATLTAATLGGAVIAQESTTFEDVDANNDGWVSFEEAFGAYPTLTQEVFDQADADGDGNLSETEFTALQGLSAPLGTSTDVEPAEEPAE